MLAWSLKLGAPDYVIRLMCHTALRPIAYGEMSV
jgi:hypothetical protein